MGIYKSSVEAYRDTTKWLAALTPATTLLTVAVALGGPLSTSLAGSESVGDWIAREWGLAACGVAMLIAVGVVLGMASRVLSVEPTEVAEILKAIKKEKASTSVEAAIGDGILAPDFYTESSFKKLALSLQADLATPGASGEDLDRDLDRLRATFETLREWKVFVTTRSRFRWFIFTVVVGTAVLGSALATAWTMVDTSAAITKPVEVSVEITPAGAASAQAATGCSDPVRSTAFANGGTWANPVLRLRGRDCDVHAEWRPTADEASVLPTP